jgi:hypothetical protein
MKIKSYLYDGANWQAQCVLAYLRGHLYNFKHDLEVTRYDNCREQGYIFYMRIGSKQTNVAVYEHRNSDALCIVSNEKLTFNAPLSQDIWETMKDKWDTTADFDCGEICNCGMTIIEIFQEFEESNK